MQMEISIKDSFTTMFKMVLEHTIMQMENALRHSTKTATKWEWEFSFIRVVLGNK